MDIVIIFDMRMELDSLKELEQIFEGNFSSMKKEKGQRGQGVRESKEGTDRKGVFAGAQRIGL